MLALAAALPLWGADARMTTEERTKVLGWLAESRKEFLAAIDEVDEAQWKWKPAPERWSVGEVAEHNGVAEYTLFRNVQKALSAAHDRSAAEGAYPGSPVSGVQHPERLPVADLWTFAHHAP